MKKHLILSILIMSSVFLGCKKEESLSIEETPESYTIEGKWVLEDYPNTAYIFENGLRYTVYCISPSCNWDTVTTTHAIPNPENYTFENDTLKIDLGFGNSISDYMVFVCGGEVVKREYAPGQYVKWSRPLYDISNCNE
jgi:hypothetical protein